MSVHFVDGKKQRWKKQQQQQRKPGFILETSEERAAPHLIDTKIKWTRALMVNRYPWLLHGNRGREGDEREKKEEKKMQQIKFKL